MKLMKKRESTDEQDKDNCPKTETKQMKKPYTILIVANLQQL